MTTVVIMITTVELNADTVIHAHVMHRAHACRVNSIMQSVRMGTLVVHAPFEHKASKQPCMQNTVAQQACNCNTLGTSNNAMLTTKP